MPLLPPSGPDSPVSPMKDLTQAMRKQQRVLEERLEACVQELKRLCLREAVRPRKVTGLTWLLDRGERKRLLKKINKSWNKERRAEGGYVI